jgi:ATP-binding protein involved in chromosome partitioning
MSMGFLVPQDAPIAWRGLMVQKAMNQLLFEVAWPKLDLLVLDLPPGTGDVQLTITQSVLLDGAIVVSTPQDLALRDAVRGVEFFDKTKTKVLGMVQNMSTFTCTNCGHHQDVFGMDGRSLFLHAPLDLMSSSKLARFFFWFRIADCLCFPLGVKKKCQELGITLLGDIPLHAQICSDADAGKPTVVGSPNSPQAEAFTQLARDLKTTLGL